METVTTRGTVERNGRLVEARHIRTGNMVIVEFKSSSAGWLPASKSLAATFTSEEFNR